MYSSNLLIVFFVRLPVVSVAFFLSRKEVSVHPEPGSLLSLRRSRLFERLLGFSLPPPRTSNISIYGLRSVQGID